MENREYGEKGTTPPKQVVDPYERYICKLDRIRGRDTHPSYRGTGSISATKLADTQDGSESSETSETVSLEISDML
jgi:hypothetical protein